jgi:hypothetical protein
MGRNNSGQTCKLKQTSTDTGKSLFKKYFFVMKKAQKHEKGRKKRIEVTFPPPPSFNIEKC